VTLPKEKYKEDPRAISYLDQAVQRLSNLPGVSSATAGTSLPLDGGWTSSYQIQGKTLRPAPHTYFAVITPAYFKTLGIQVVRGRAFQDSDRENTQPVAILDERAVRQYFGNEDPIGQHISLETLPNMKGKGLFEIVGVVSSVRHSTTVLEETKGQTYLPYTQLAPRSFEFAIHTKGDPTAIVASVRNELRSLDPGLPLYNVTTMEAKMAENLAQPRFNTVLLGVFGGLALMLAAIGIYGVLSYTVTQRTHEIGLRMALGASQGDVLKMVMKHAIRLTGIGIVAGVVAALVASKALASLLFRISHTDPITYIGIVAILGGVALIAAYAPARRATKVDPMVALRNE
jgi:predicted permease